MGLFKWLFGPSKAELRREAFQIEFEVRQGVEAEHNRFMQEIEDLKIGAEINAGALDMLRQWTNLETKNIGRPPELQYIGLIIPPLMSCTYTIYDPATAKYADSNIGELRSQKYRELRAEYSPINI